MSQLNNHQRTVFNKHISEIIDIWFMYNPLQTEKQKEALKQTLILTIRGYYDDRFEYRR